MADLFHDRPQGGNRHNLRHIVKDTFAVIKWGAALCAVVGLYVFLLVWRFCHLQGVSLMPQLSARLLACLLAQSLGAANNLCLNVLLRGRGAAVAGVLARHLVLGQPCLQLLYQLVQLMHIRIKLIYSAVLLVYDSLLRVYCLAHRPPLHCHGLQHFRYVHNILIHNCKGTKKI